MNSKVTIEVDVKHETLVRRTLALAAELEHLALTAPDGDVFQTCEVAADEKGRKLQSQILAEAVTRRIDVAEKKGRRSASVHAVAKKKIVARKNAD